LIRDWPELGALRTESLALERLEADVWLVLLEHVYERIEGGEKCGALSGAMVDEAEQLLAPVAIAVDALLSRCAEVRSALAARGQP
jgi:hypothetical protein